MIFELSGGRSNWIVLTTPGPTLLLSRIACLSDPGPESAAVVTVNVVGERRRREGKRKQSHQTHTPLAAASLSSTPLPVGPLATAAVTSCRAP